MYNLLISPPVAFVIILLLSWGMSYLSSLLAFRRKGSQGALNKAYAGGEDVKVNRVQPDYSQFFPFAFFFTILHVVTLMVATVPTATPGSFAITVIYLLGALIGLLILFRR